MSRGLRVVVLGGGLSGVAAACELMRGGAQDVTVVEAGDALGGLAGSFLQDSRFYPLGYHHILHRDRTLLRVLREIGVLSRVRWRRIHLAFFEDGRLQDLSSPTGFARHRMTVGDKVRFLSLMLRCAVKSDWSDWEDRSAADLVDAWAGPGVRDAIFEPLARIRFELPCDAISGAWLGARLFHREGSARLGFIPGTNWTRVLCEGLAAQAEALGVKVRLRTSVTGLQGRGGLVEEVTLSGGEAIRADRLVSTLPPQVYRRLIDDDTPGLAEIGYTAMLSMICASRRALPPRLYWVSLTEPGHTACGIFQLNALNPTIGIPGHACVNFVTHLRDRHRPVFGLSDAELLEAYRADFRAVFGGELDPYWVRLNRLPMYAPVMRRGFRNLPVRSARWENVYFAGNYRTFPSVLSTGTAMQSGFDTAAALLREAT